MKVLLDLKKKRYKIFTDAIDFVRAYKNVDYVMVDIKCRLKVFLKNDPSNFFHNISDLNIGYWFLFLRIYAFIINF